MGLEFLADPGVGDAYPIELVPLAEEPAPEAWAAAACGAEAEPPAFALDWRPTLEAVVEERRRGVAGQVVAARFHNALVEGIGRVARAIGEPAVALSGGCFQNRLLVERVAARLDEAGFRVLLHRQVPPNDGGISFGQVAVAAARAGVELAPPHHPD
jgi:hydrogenase maturation protein HypF